MLKTDLPSLLTDRLPCLALLATACTRARDSADDALGSLAALARWDALALVQRLGHILGAWFHIAL